MDSPRTGSPARQAAAALLEIDVGAIVATWRALCARHPKGAVAAVSSSTLPAVLDGPLPGTAEAYRAHTVTPGLQTPRPPAEPAEHYAPLSPIG